MVRYSTGADNDAKYLKEVQFPADSVIVFEGYRDYSLYNRFTTAHIRRVPVTGIGRCTNQRKTVSETQGQQGINTERDMEPEYHHSKKAVKVPARMIGYPDPGNREKNSQQITISWLLIVSLSRKVVKRERNQQWHFQILLDW